MFVAVRSVCRHRQVDPSRFATAPCLMMGPTSACVCACRRDCLRVPSVAWTLRDPWPLHADVGISHRRHVRLRVRVGAQCLDCWWRRRKHRQRPVSPTAADDGDGGGCACPCSISLSRIPAALAWARPPVWGCVWGALLLDRGGWLDKHRQRRVSPAELRQRSLLRRHGWV
jgi:hypothetical protein